MAIRSLFLFFSIYYFTFTAVACCDNSYVLGAWPSGRLWHFCLYMIFNITVIIVLILLVFYDYWSCVHCYSDSQSHKLVFNAARFQCLQCSRRKSKPAGSAAGRCPSNWSPARAWLPSRRLLRLGERVRMHRLCRVCAAPTEGVAHESGASRTVFCVAARSLGRRGLVGILADVSPSSLL